MLVLFSDALLLAEHNTFGAKLSVFHWWLPESAEGARPGEAPGAVHVRRSGTGETLTFVVSPPAEAAGWLADLRRVCMLHSSRERTATLMQHGAQAAGRTVSNFAPNSKAAAAAASKGSGVIAGWLMKKGGGGATGAERNWAKGGRRNWKKR